MTHLTHPQKYQTEDGNILTAKLDPTNRNCFDVFFNGNFFGNFPANTEEGALEYANEHYIEEYLTPKPYSIFEDN